MVGSRRADAGFRQPVLAQHLQRFYSETQQVPFSYLLHLLAQRGIFHQLFDGEPSLMHMRFNAAEGAFAAGADGSCC
jgi:hypothetical protein